MNAAKKTSLEQWIQSVLNDVDYERPCSHISLQHLTVGGAETELKTTKIGNGRPWTAKDLAEFFLNIAQTYCQDLAGVHTFRLLAFYGTNEARARHPFMLPGQVDNGGLGTEPPTEAGQRMQHMRHTEALTQGMIQERLALLDQPIRIIRAMSEHQATLMKELHETRAENLDAIRLAKELILEEATKRSERELAAKKFERESKDREMMLKFLPLIVNEVTGKEIIPQSSADSMLIDALAENLTEEGAQKIMATGAIPQEVMGIIMSRLAKSLQRKRELQEEALARGSEADTDAAEDPLLLEKNETHEQQ